MTKKSFDIDGLSEESKNTLDKQLEKNLKHASGIAGDPLYEPVPNFIIANNEKIINGSNNTWIVLGRDRPSNRLSGYGGKGHTQSAAIYIVVGRMGSAPKENVWVDPNFELDAARIYISQKTDIDKNFKIANGKIGPAEAKSAIGLKADHIRIIGREAIKLVTGVDQKNSQGGTVDTTFGVDLIAGNLQDGDIVIEDSKDSHSPGMQPIPKGKSLELTLTELLNQVDSLSGLMSAFLKAQMDFNAILGTHFHISPFFGMPTLPSETAAQAAIQANMNLLQDCIIGLQKFKTNLVNYKNNHLKPYGKNYFNSKYHSLN